MIRVPKLQHVWPMVGLLGLLSVAAAVSEPARAATASSPTVRSVPAGASLAAEEYPSCTITGSREKDVIEGTPGDDVICGLGSDDVIYGNNGDDIVLGGRGHDALYGGNGHDTLVGEVGGDRLEGRGGNDTLDMADGVQGNDAAGGGGGNDTCSKDPKDRCAEDAASSFDGSVAVIDADLQHRMRYSWRPGCPVGFGDLRYLELNVRDYEGRVQRGELVVHEDEAQSMLDAVKQAWEARFPIAKMVLVDDYQGDDDLSMAANNSSAFNCRYVAGTTTWSQHAYGLAIDINPIQNPYIKQDGSIVPPAGKNYTDRSNVREGMIVSGDVVVEAFESIGWEWGGYWVNSKDYQHFSENGK